MLKKVTKMQIFLRILYFIMFTLFISFNFLPYLEECSSGDSKISTQSMAGWAQLNVAGVDSWINTPRVKCKYKLPSMLQYVFRYFFFHQHEYTGGLVGKLGIFSADWELREVAGNCFGGVKYFVVFVSPTVERLCPFFWMGWEGVMMQFQLMEHGTVDLDMADFVMNKFDCLYLHPFNFLVMNFIYDFSIALTQILRMMRK